VGEFCEVECSEVECSDEERYDNTISIIEWDE
jgi:hypothetical protein